MASYRDYYFPNTEPLAANEMRIIALGTEAAICAARTGQLFLAD